MSENSMRFFTALVFLFAGMGLSHAQTSDPPPEEEIVDMDVMPEAVEALDRMAEFLRGLDRFVLRARTTRDDVLEDELKVQIGAHVTYEVIIPNKLKLETVSDQQWRVYYYNGETVTQYAPTLGYYSIFDAAPTIAETLDIAFDEYGVEMPLAGLFYWGTERSTVQELTQAIFVGEARIGDRTCNHYAYRSQGADFQMWIAKRGDPIPCKMVVTTTEDPARPEYEAILDWEIDPLLSDNMFEFAPVEGDTRIEQEKIPSGN